MNTNGVISPDTPINEVIRAYPTTVAVFYGYGMDACCGGDLPVQVAAERHGVPLERLIADLEQKVARG